jgi:hypothetical protein
MTRKSSEKFGPNSAQAGIIAAEAEESPKSKPFVLGNSKTQPPLPTTWEPADETTFWTKV